MAEPKPGNTQLRRARGALNRTQEEITDDLKQCADRMYDAGELSKRVSFSVRQYSKWEGALPPWPHPEARRVIQTFFRRPIIELGFSPPYGEEPQPPLEAVRVIPSSEVRNADETLGPSESQSLPWLTPIELVPL